MRSKRADLTRARDAAVLILTAHFGVKRDRYKNAFDSRPTSALTRFSIYDCIDTVARARLATKVNKVQVSQSLSHSFIHSFINQSNVRTNERTNE